MGGALEPQCISRSPLGHDDDENSISARYRMHMLPRKLGQGQFSKAYTCWRKDEEETYYAMKVFNEKQDACEHAMNEVEVLKHLGQHSRIVQLIESEMHDEDVCPVYVVLELCEGGQLFDRLMAKRHYDEDEGSQVVQQLLEAVEFMHGRGVMHRDLKLENVLLVSPDSDVDIKVCDFGIAKMAEPVPCQDPATPDAVMPLVMRRGVPRSSSVKGSHHYLAPEVIRQEEYGPAIDMWALGVIAFGILGGALPFSSKDDNMRELYSKIVYCELEFAGEVWEEKSQLCKDFIESLLIIDPQRRPSAKDAMHHSWLAQASMSSVASASSASTAASGSWHPLPGLAAKARAAAG